MTSIFSKERVVNKVVLLNTNEIVPNPAQPRLTFNHEELMGLAKSIKENGVIQPISVRKNVNNQFELISGERRLKASKLAGMDSIPCIISDVSDKQSAILALLENIQRKDLNFFEEAGALVSLLSEWNITQEEAAFRLGMAQSTIANKIRLLKLKEEEQKLIVANNLTERHARAVLKIKTDDLRKQAIKYIIKNNLNVAQSEKYIEALINNNGKDPNKRRLMIVKDVRLFFNTINKAIDTMKKAGIAAQAKKTDQGDYIEYVVKIPIKT
ncbi:MAG: parB5 [Oscillospiraceae bacterium]|jgi:ParB family chromosome partitioning protein|nr:parB5 [Oscillospiraceae bacterium]